MAEPALTTTTTTVSSILHHTSSITLQRAHQAQSSNGWSSPDSLLTKLFTGDPSTILFAFVVTISLPVLLHLYFYTQSARSSRSGGGAGGDGTPTVLVVGPSGSGKTGLVTLLQRRAVALSGKSTGRESDEKPEAIAVNGHNDGHISASPTRLSQTSSTIGMILPPGTPLGSNKYRSENDYEVTRSKKEGAKYKMIDTPGHGKLRLEQAVSHITKTTATTGLRGVIFMVDSSAMDTSTSETAAETAQDTIQYLHDVLLALQRRPRTVKKARAEDVRVLVACNKQDLFTSLPAQAVRKRLEDGVERVRVNRRKGISAVDVREDLDEDEDQTVLGGGGEQLFSFKSLEEEYGVAVDVIGGAVKGDEEGNGVRKWEEWIGGCL